jgi:hypothetical protein
MFSDLMSRWRWRPIPQCPGRFVLATGPSRVRPETIAREAGVSEYVVSNARDPVIVARFDDGGLISYRKRDGTYLHTLNSAEGFGRKLQQLGIDIIDEQPMASR